MLVMKNISKSFFGVTVLDHVDLIVKKGEVHALLGENGAGKSTLMNILAGVHTRDDGTVFFNGSELVHNSVQQSEHVGIAFVHQELNVFNDLTVYENIFLRKEIRTKLGYLNKPAMIRRTYELFTELGVDIDPMAMVSELETSKKQLLEIAKALFANAQLFILDEPTTALNNREIDHLFAIINRLKAQGKSFIFISHKMNEIFEIADRYTILRNGRFIESGQIADTTPTKVAMLMVGSGYSDKDIYEPRPLGNTILDLKNYSGEGFHDVNLSIRRGEVIGFTGLKGAGSSEVMQTIFGVLPCTGGELYVNGKRIAKMSIHKAMEQGIAMIPANRKENSVFPDLTILENHYLSEHELSRKNPVISQKKEVSRYARQKQQLNIKANSCLDPITSLSGGNQQKVILARWLNTDADVILMDNPTQGIDIGAKAEIYKLILNLARMGKTVVVNTLEIPEVQKVADRCIVFFHGGIKKVLERDEISEERVMLYATNAIDAVKGDA